MVDPSCTISPSSGSFDDPDTGQILQIIFCIIVIENVVYDILYVNILFTTIICKIIIRPQ